MAAYLTLRTLTNGAQNWIVFHQKKEKNLYVLAQNVLGNCKESATFSSEHERRSFSDELVNAMVLLDAHLSFNSRSFDAQIKRSIRAELV